MTTPDSPLAMLWAPSPNHGERNDARRPDMIVLHYTGMQSVEAALRWLTCVESRVSCHYLVDEAGRVVQMVAEDRRAWHAGLGAWGPDGDINSCSIGIEIHNSGHDFDYPDYPEVQMAAVEALCVDIAGRHAIPAARTLAHSDVSPARKRDPGEKFDWARLARAGIGAWVEPEAPSEGAFIGIGDEGDHVAELQQTFLRFGYTLDATGTFGRATEQVVTAFQRHFRPARVDGRADASTVSSLERLLGLNGPCA